VVWGAQGAGAMAHAYFENPFGAPRC